MTLSRSLVAMALVGALGCAGRSAAARVEPAPMGASAIRAECKGRMDFGGEKVRFEAALALKGSDRLYAEISGPMGGPRAVLAVRGERLIVLLPPSREFLDEPASAPTFEALLGIPLESKALIEMLRLAGTLESRRLEIASSDAGGPSALLVTGRQDGLRADVEGPVAGGLRSLEIQVRSMARLADDALPEGIFSPDIPDGWARLRPPEQVSELPALLS